MIQDSELRIPKNEVRVEIQLLGGGDAEDYFVYLNQCSPFHSGPESLDEYLAAADSFIPVRCAADQRPLLLNLAEVLFVREKEPCEEAGERAIRLHFRGGLDLEVKHFELLPAFHARPIDFFNSPHAFLPFLQGGRKLYIRKANVASISGI